MAKTVVRLTLLFLLVLLGGTAFGETLSVTVRETQLRSSPAFLGRVLEELSYGDQVERLSERSGWMEVRADSGTEGWVHGSALTEKRIVLNASESEVDTGASRGEVALAGRGFNQEVENQYKEETGLDFSRIDEIESREMSAEALIAFLREGGLEIPGGGE